jgi:hypothetical protein
VIGHVNVGRHFQFRGLVPERVQARIVRVQTLDARRAGVPAKARSLVGQFANGGIPMLPIWPF